jgi:hypothetical protein
MVQDYQAKDLERPNQLLIVERIAVKKTIQKIEGLSL